MSEEQLEQADVNDSVETEDNDSGITLSEIEEDTEESTNDEPEATATEDSEEPEEEPLSAAAQKLIATKAFEAREASRKAKELEQRLAAIEQQSSTQPKAVELTVPDRWDFDSDAEYQKAINAYADAKAAQVVDQQRQQFEQQQKQALQQQALAEQYKTLETKVASYTEKAKALGINSTELSTAGDVVASYGIRDDIAGAILSDDEGALMTMYLASNPSVIAKLNAASNFMEAASLFGTIKTKAAAMRRKPSNAPKPPTVLKSSSGKSEGLLKGATFE